ncbi:MAG TPA: cation:proton antiporter [Phycisphaerae bacterium]|nr:cation:proton antiporter [Phycisphaerae bacterium]
MHDLSLITTIAAAFTAAWLLGLLTQWLRLSPIVGYLLAGVLIGPHTPGFVGDVHLAQQLAEVGVILLMFGVGLHFHLKDLLAVKGVAIPGAIGQSLVATALAIAVFAAFDLPIKTGAVIGMAMAVASTVVLMRVLMDADALNSPQGHVAVGWLIVEDIFTVILLVLIPVLGQSSESAAVEGGAIAASATGSSLWRTLGVAMLKLGALVAIVMLAGYRIVPGVLVRVAKLRSRELFTLTVLVFSIAVAAGSYFFFGASMALGAFLAGMVVAQSPVSHQAAADALPLRDAFAVLFFVSVGMLFDPAFLIQKPLMVAAALGIILLAKPAAALVIVALLGHSARTALTVAIGLAQIGEFSFILSDLARRHGLMTEAGHNVLVAAAIISITLNPLLFRSLPKAESWLRKRPRLWRLMNNRAERRVLSINKAASNVVARASRDHQRLAIVVGYGPVGRSVHRLLQEAKLSTVVVDLNMDTVSALNAEGQTAIFGDASNESILDQAGVRRASHLVLTLPHSSDRVAVVTAARNFNTNVRILVRARYLREREDLERAGASAAVFEEAEAAVALARLVLADTGMHREAADRKIKDLRLRLIMENISNISSQRVGSVMVPWPRVRWLPASADINAVLAQVAQERFSRWPVVEPQTGRATGYLLTKDLIAHASNSDWSRMLRPLKAIRPDESIESTLTGMQAEGATVYVVEDGDRPVGLITLEDILEQVVGQIEDEYPHEARVSLADAVANGGIVLELVAKTREQCIRELVEAIPRNKLPSEVTKLQIVNLTLAREEELSTDLGNGIAIPHARCPKLAAPLVVFGRSTEGVVFSPAAQELVRLLFLLVTPAEQPEAQLALLGQLAKIAATDASRDALLHAANPGEVVRILRGESGGESGELHLP